MTFRTENNKFNNELLEFVKIVKSFGLDYRYDASCGWVVVIENVTEDVYNRLKGAERLIFKGEI